jgi:hypothetical protein
MLRLKLLQGEEEAYLARLCAGPAGPARQTLADEVAKLRTTLVGFEP